MYVWCIHYSQSNILSYILYIYSFYPFLHTLLACPFFYLSSIYSVCIFISLNIFNGSFFKLLYLNSLLHWTNAVYLNIAAVEGLILNAHWSSIYFTQWPPMWFWLICLVLASLSDDSWIDVATHCVLRLQKVRGGGWRWQWLIWTEN